MKAKDNTVRITVYREVVTRRLTLTLGTASLHPFDGYSHESEAKWKAEDLLCYSRPGSRKSRSSCASSMAG